MLFVLVIGCGKLLWNSAHLGTFAASSSWQSSRTPSLICILGKDCKHHICVKPAGSIRCEGQDMRQQGSRYEIICSEFIPHLRLLQLLLRLGPFLPWAAVPSPPRYLHSLCSLSSWNSSHDEVRILGPETVSGFHRAEWMNVTQAVHAYRISPKFMTALVRVPSW